MPANTTGKKGSLLTRVTSLKPRDVLFGLRDALDEPDKGKRNILVPLSLLSTGLPANIVAALQAAPDPDAIRRFALLSDIGLQDFIRYGSAPGSAQNNNVVYGSPTNGCDIQGDDVSNNTLYNGVNNLIRSASGGAADSNSITDGADNLIENALSVRLTNCQLSTVVEGKDMSLEECVEVNVSQDCQKLTLSTCTRCTITNCQNLRLQDCDELVLTGRSNETYIQNVLQVAGGGGLTASRGRFGIITAQGTTGETFNVGDDTTAVYNVFTQVPGQAPVAVLPTQCTVLVGTPSQLTISPTPPLGVRIWGDTDAGTGAGGGVGGDEIELAENDVAYMLFTGQSNPLSNADLQTTTYSPMPELFPGDVNEAFANVRILNVQSGLLEPLQNGVNTRPDEANTYPQPYSFHPTDAGVWDTSIQANRYNFNVISPLYYLAKQFKAKYPFRQLVVAQCAVGGEPRAAFLKGSGRLWNRLAEQNTAVVNAITAEGKNPRLLLVLMNQGEADQALSVAAYNTQLRTFWEDVASDIATSETQFLEYGTPVCYDTGSQYANPHNGTKAQWAAEAVNRHYQNPNFVVHEEDGIHWNGPSQAYAAAVAFGVAFRAALSFPLAITPTAPSLVFHAASNEIEIVPPNANWLKREFYYQFNGGTVKRLINSWRIPLTGTVGPGGFSAWVRSCPGRNESAHISNPVQWNFTGTGRLPVADGLITWLPEKGVGTTFIPYVLRHAAGASDGWFNYAPANFRLKPFPNGFEGEYCRIKLKNLTRVRSAIVVGFSALATPSNMTDILGLYMDNGEIAMNNGSAALVGRFNYDEPVGDYSLVVSVTAGNASLRLVRESDGVQIASLPFVGSGYVHAFCYGNEGWASNQQASTVSGAEVDCDYLEQAFLS